MKPLANITVLDLSRMLPGPFLTRLLCDLGADVIKVEDAAGDMTRYVPPLSEDGHAAAFTALNAGKRSVVLNLKRRADVEVLLALAARADVMVESFRPGVLDRLGLAYATLRERNPRLVLCSITGYGQSGPLQKRPGHDLNYLARAGVLSLFGPTDGVPVVPGVQIADVGGGAMSAAVGILSALLLRQSTGKGAHLDISMTRSAMAFSIMELARRAGGGADQSASVEARGAGMLTGGLPCYRVYRTRDDRFMSLGALEPKFFAAFCERAGCPHLASDGLLTGERGKAVMAELEALFATRTQTEWVALLGDSESCCEPVVTPEEALRDPELALCTGMVSGVPVALPHVGWPVSLAPSARAPALGEHTDEVLRQLEIDPGLIARWRAAEAE